MIAMCAEKLAVRLGDKVRILPSAPHIMLKPNKKRAVAKEAFGCEHTLEAFSIF